MGGMFSKPKPPAPPPPPPVIPKPEVIPLADQGSANAYYKKRAAKTQTGRVSTIMDSGHDRLG